MSDTQARVVTASAAFALGLMLFWFLVLVGIAFRDPETAELHHRLGDGRTVTCVYTRTSFGALSCDWDGAHR